VQGDFPTEFPNVERTKAGIDLVMQADQENNTDDDCGEEYLADVIVEDPLVGVGGAAAVEFFLGRYFTGGSGPNRGRYILFVHVLDSLSSHGAFPTSSALHGGVPPSPGARVFITKVPL
jgi:hypothetical protein